MRTVGKHTGKMEACLQTLAGAAGGLLFTTCAHTGCCEFVWASERCETLQDSRHFVNFAAIVLQAGSSELHLPHS